MVRILIVTSAAAAALLSGCQTVETTEAGVVGVDRDQQMMVSAEEVHAGQEVAHGGPGLHR